MWITNIVKEIKTENFQKFRYSFKRTIIKLLHVNINNTFMKLITFSKRKKFESEERHHFPVFPFFFRFPVFANLEWLALSSG